MKLYDKMLVVLSGGQDSTTCLYWAKDISEHVVAITFDYGQRHKIEIEAAKKIAKIANVRHIVQNAMFINELAPSALTRDIKIENPDSGLPNTFVPGRNIFFLSMAAVVAKINHIDHVVTGVCQTDYSGYPDCRADSINHLQTALRYGMDFYYLTIWTPLMHLNKAESVNLAMTLPGCLEALAYSHTCYEGVFPPCGQCPACLLRAKGFETIGILDPLITRVNHPNKIEIEDDEEEE